MRASTLCIALVAACAAESTPASRSPEAVLSSSTEATRAFAELRDAWLGSRPDHAVLRDRFDAFCARYPADALAPLARLYAANAAIELGDVAGADARLRGGAPSTAPGMLADFTTLTRARLRRARGDAPAALALLRPLRGKVIDTALRNLLEEELVLGAVESRRESEAIFAMDAWLRDSGEDEAPRVLARVDAAIARLSTDTIRQALRSIRTDPSRSASPALARRLAKRLADVAVQTNDGALAQWLLEGAQGPSVVSGAEFAALKDVATSLRGQKSVRGRSLGIVLPTRTPSQRDAAADVARGVAFALDLPRRTDADVDATRLLTRSADTEDAELVAMDELVGEGAAVIVAGLDDVAADRAQRWADRVGVAVLLLSGTRASAATRWAFRVGDSLDRMLGPLVAELDAASAGPVAIVADTEGAEALKTLLPSTLRALEPASCDDAFPRPRLPVSSWRASGATTLVVSGPDTCARGAAMAAQAMTLALDVRACGGVDLGSLSAPAWVAVTGAFPPGAPSARADDELARYTRATGHVPTFWTALGYDAARLARRALAALPPDETTAPAEVQRRHQLARDTLTGVRATLWTSDAEGFDADLAIARKLRVVRVPARSHARPR